jgi:hypothetical protein
VVATLEEKRRSRLQFMDVLYQLAGGARYKAVDMYTIGDQLQLSWNQTLDVQTYLIEEGLIEPLGAGPQVQLTHKGIVEVEASQRRPDLPTDHFPAARTVSIINVGRDMVGSQVQQATQHSQQSGDFMNADQATGMRDFLRLVTERLDALALPADDLQDVKAQLQTIEVQLHSGRPRRSLVQGSLAVIKTTLDVVAAGVTVGPPSVDAAQFLLANFPRF